MFLAPCVAVVASADETHWVSGVWMAGGWGDANITGPANKGRGDPSIYEIQQGAMSLVGSDDQCIFIPCHAKELV